MILKFNPALIFARQRAEHIQKPLSKEKWINADRLVMIVMFAFVIAMAVAFT